MITYKKKRGDVVLIEEDKDWYALINVPTEYGTVCSLELGDIGSNRTFYLSLKEVERFKNFIDAVSKEMDAIQTEANESRVNTIVNDWEEHSDHEETIW